MWFEKIHQYISMFFPLMLSCKISFFTDPAFFRFMIITQLLQFWSLIEYFFNSRNNSLFIIKLQKTFRYIFYFTFLFLIRNLSQQIKEDQSAFYVIFLIVCIIFYTIFNSKKIKYTGNIFFFYFKE